MPSPTKISSLFLLLITLLSSLHTHARDNQFFNKIPNLNPNTNQPPNNQQEENNPNFVPLNENPYGLHSQDSGHLPHSATTTTTYDPVSYATEPEEISDNTDENSFTTNPNNNYHNDAQNYYYNSQQEEEETPSYKSYPNRKHNNYYYNHNGGATLSSRQNYFNNGGEGNEGFRQQGMSDTRFLENGKYFYDVNTEKYSRNHPYERLRRVRARNEYNNMNSYYGSGENAYEFNGQDSMAGYQNQVDEFQDEENNMP